MADVTGPIGSLPGTTHQVPQGMTCDDHPERAAVVRIQGETDSFGSEMIDMCQECYDNYCAEVRNTVQEEHACDWCGNMAVLRNRRDYDEGLYGPVYQVCGACITRANEAAAEELVDTERYYSPDDDPGFDDYINNLDE